MTEQTALEHRAEELRSSPRTEAEARAELKRRREEKLAGLRAELRRDGAPDAIADDMTDSVRRGLAFGDFLDRMFGGTR